MQIDDLLKDSRILDLEGDESLDTNDSPDLGWEGSSLTKKRRTLKKAPEAPKRFKSAYICFVMEKMDQMKQAAGPDVKVKFSSLIFRGLFSVPQLSMVKTLLGDRINEEAGGQVENPTSYRKKQIRRSCGSGQDQVCVLTCVTIYCGRYVALTQGPFASGIFKSFPHTRGQCKFPISVARRIR
jgi:hypothetical protein